MNKCITTVLFTLLLGISEAYPWTQNNSDQVIFLKPENARDQIVSLAPGKKYNGGQDGLLVDGNIFKTCNSCNVIVGKAGTIQEISCQGLLANACQILRGGWKDGDWAKIKHRDWLPLYCAFHACEDNTGELMKP